jgi:hypothetical protein
VTAGRPVYVTTGRHPFEVAPLGACVVVGLLMGAGGVRPPAMTAGLAEPMLTGWLLSVAAGGAVGLVGAYWRGDVDDSLMIEFCGVLAVAATCTLYVAALFAINPVTVALAAGGLLAGLAVGAWLRLVQIARDWLRLRRSDLRQVRVDLPLMVENGAPPGAADATEPGGAS